MNNALSIAKIVFLMCFLMAVSNCSTVNPLLHAKTTEQRAYALYGTYVIFVEKAADLAENPKVSKVIKLRIIEAEEKASPIMDAILDVLIQYERIKLEVSKQQTDTQKLVIVSENLNLMISEAMPLVESIIKAVKGAQNEG